MSRRLLCVVFSLGTVLAPSAWAQIPIGPEFQVNTYTTGSQYQQSIATDAAGNFVVVWASIGQDGSQGGIFARKYLAAGTPIGSSEFRVNAYTTGSQDAPSVASDPSGRLVMVWQSVQDGSSSGVFGRRFDASGAAGPEFQVNTYTTSYQMFPSVAMDAGGNFVVAWQSYRDGGGFGVFAQRYNAAGAPQGSEFQVNTYTTSDQYRPAVAMGADGNFVVVWATLSAQDGASGGVFGRRYDAAGVAQGGEFLVNSYVTGSQYEAAAAAGPDGSFLVVWTTLDGISQGVSGRRFNASGVPLAAEFKVNAYTPGPQRRAAASIDAAGNFVVAWRSLGQDGSNNGVFARAFDSAGVPQGGELQVNSFTPNSQAFPSVAAQPGGRFVVAWRSDGQDGSSYGEFGRRVATDLIFRDGFESGDLSKWSSAATDGGDLSTSVVAAMKSTSHGLQGVVDDTASVYVQDDLPDDESRYRARFYFDTNGFDPGESGGAHRTRVFLAFEEAPTRRLAAIVLKRLGSVYSIEGRARLDDDSQADTGFFDIADGAHFVEIDWKASSGPDANDGTFQLSIDGVVVSTLLNLDNSRSAVDFVRLGALSVKPTATGTLFWDEFESRRINAIGP